MSICDGKIYAVTNEHSPSTPLYRGSKMYCIDAATGQGLWNISFWGLFPVIADGYAVSFNYYDGRVYCFGKGESETTITTSPKVSTLGSSVLIEGKVTDKTSSANGTAAVSDTSMANWMEYLYMQQPQPTNATGVTVNIRRHRRKRQLPQHRRSNHRLNRRIQLCMATRHTRKIHYNGILLQVPTRTAVHLQKQQYKSMKYHHLHRHQ